MRSHVQLKKKKTKNQHVFFLQVIIGLFLLHLITRVESRYETETVELQIPLLKLHSKGIM